MSRKTVSTLAWVRFQSSMYFRMSLQIVDSDKAFVAMIAFELTITEMSLDMRFDILLAPKFLSATRVDTSPFLSAVYRTIFGIGLFHVRRDVVKRDTGTFN